MYSAFLMAALTTGSGALDGCIKCGEARCSPCCQSWCSSNCGFPGWEGGCASYSGWANWFAWWDQCLTVWGVYEFGWPGCQAPCGGSLGLPPSLPPASEPLQPPKPEQKKPITTDRARLTVQIPTDARLYVDEQLVKNAASSQRTFKTPQLEPGHTYFYELKAEIIREGKPVTQSKRVLVKAGQNLMVTFSGLESSQVASSETLSDLPDFEGKNKE